ncbi:MAG: phospholipid carrier-dependent glycosyltransferase [Candidatus Moranbacteria bacterium]|nr:phospholipid carrier-dependent glycosyltransferase [Candidatus Moranbacteria bacterium]
MKKNTLGWSGLALLVIIVAAIFVRTYKFDDYLYFKMDQSRDALLLTNAVENGPQYLPLLGARVGAVKLKHGFLRLGPISYYFQYLSAVVFHSTQAYVYAYPDLMFSILTIPLLFFFLRLYFSKHNALFITAMYAFSFIIIQYSRFAWNPNSLQFFLLLTFYGLLRFFNETNEKLRRRWLALWAVGMIIGSQLHFFGFFSLVGISGLMIIFHYELWKKENISNHLQKEAMKGFAKYAAIVLLVFTIFYTPLIISDVFRKGENTHNFFEALTSKPVNKPLSQKIVKTTTENLKYYCLITTSQCYGSDMKKEYPAIAATVLVLLSGLLLVVYNLRKKVLTKTKKDFLILLAVWVAVFTILTVPVAFQLRPRFFIVVFAIPFISLGLFFEYLEEKMNRKNAILLAVLLTAGVIGWNTHGTLAWFKEQADSQKKAVIVKRTLILKAKDGVTLGQLQGVTDWMYSRHKQGDTLYYYVKPEHVRPITFLLHEKRDQNLVSTTMTINNDPNAQYFAVVPTKNGLEPLFSKYPNNKISVVAQQQFGQLTVFEVAIGDRSTSATFRFNKSSSKKDDRIYWKDVFGIKENKDNKNLIPISGDE